MVKTRARFAQGRSQTPWRFLDTGYADPFYNMAVDEAIAIVGREGWPPTVRVYAWRPAAISIGYSQRVHSTVSLKKCARRGIPLVRRLTGGRAVFHDQEVTYSVIAERGHLQSSGSVLETYKHIGQGLISSLERLGVQAFLRRVGFGDAEHGSTCDLTPCFTSSGRYEVTIGDRKVVGSAQRQIGEVVLQHGSLLTGEGHLKIAQLLPLGLAEGDKMAQELRDKTISLGALLLRPVSYTEVAEALFLGFQAAFQVPMEPGQLRSDEEELAHRLIRERYGRQEWTLRR